MERPKSTSMMLASEWVSHLGTEVAWEEMREVVDSDPERAWTVILSLIGSAPDYGVLAAVAAGPLEDLVSEHSDSALARVEQQARSSARFRIALRATYLDLPPELSAIIGTENADVRDLPAESVAVSGDDLSLMIGWLHHSDTSWAYQFLEEMTENEPDAAWDVLRVLALFAEEDPRIRDDVFTGAFEPFMQRNFSSFREQLVALGRKSAALRQWAREQKRPLIPDAAAWTAFVNDITAV